MNYDLEKIRVACLELMGWRRETQQNWRDKQTDVIWTGPDGKERYEGLWMPITIPEPTKSIDDVLPLMRRYEISLFCARDGRWGASKPCCRTAAESFFDSDYEEEIADNPALAVCQMALRCAGRILEDFEVSP